MAHAVDLLAAGNWQRGDGKGDRPTPIPRPNSVESTGRELIPATDFRRRMAEFAERQRAQVVNDDG